VTDENPMDPLSEDEEAELREHLLPWGAESSRANDLTARLLAERDRLKLDMESQAAESAAAWTQWCEQRDALLREVERLRRHLAQAEACIEDHMEPFADRTHVLCGVILDSGYPCTLPEAHHSPHLTAPDAARAASGKGGEEQ
jgi:hypothetical protein